MWRKGKCEVGERECDWLWCWEGNVWLFSFLTAKIIIIIVNESFFINHQQYSWDLPFSWPFNVWTSSLSSRATAWSFDLCCRWLGRPHRIKKLTVPDPLEVPFRVLCPLLNSCYYIYILKACSFWGWTSWQVFVVGGYLHSDNVVVMGFFLSWVYWKNWRTLLCRHMPFFLEHC